MVDRDTDEYRKIKKEIFKLRKYITLIKKALKKEDYNKLYILVNIVIHKYKDYITISDWFYDKEIKFCYYNYKYDLEYNETIIYVKSRIYEEMIANDNK